VGHGAQWTVMDLQASDPDHARARGGPAVVFLNSPQGPPGRKVGRGGEIERDAPRTARDPLCGAMTGRDLLAAGVGAAAMAGVLFGVEHWGHSRGSARPPAVASTGVAEGAPPASDDEAWRVANKNLAQAVQIAERRLRKNEAEKTGIEGELKQAKSLLAAPCVSRRTVLLRLTSTPSITPIGRSLRRLGASWPGTLAGSSRTGT
jgi:hypothetical protein